jgi:hypothetical protein
MITNSDRDGITDMVADQRHVSSTMDQRIVQQVAEGVFEPLPIRNDGDLIGLYGDLSTLKLRTPPGPVGHLVEQTAKRE